MKLTLIVESLLVVNWCIYSLYNIYYDCRSHTGYIISLVEVGVLSLSLK